MPTPLIPSEKAAFVALVKVAPRPGGPTEAMRLASTDFFNNYEDIPYALQRQLDLFAGEPSYLNTCMSVFTDANLLAAGIYNGATVPSGATNPRVVINSTINVISITSNQPLLLILNSSVGRINMTFGVYLTFIYMSGSVTDLVNANFSSAFIGQIYIKNVNNNPSTLKGVMMGSLMGGMINQILPDPGVTYGGVVVYDPDNACANQISNLNAGDITHNSVTLMWNLPPNPSWSYASFLFLYIYYKLENASGWIRVDNTQGDFIQQVGFVFRYLQSDTRYDFMVTLVCTNGGTNSEHVIAQTVCCGDKEVATGKECWFTIVMLDTPGIAPYTNPDTGDIIPVTITLCNGAQIAGQYQTGTTLTIPYLANQSVDQTIIVNNQYQQGIPYNQVLAQWDLAGTPLGEFLNGDIVSLKAFVPS